MDLPEWKDYGSASQEEKMEWNRMMTALRAHEQQHAALYNSYIGDATVSATSSSCDEVTATEAAEAIAKKQADEMSEARMLAIQLANKALDFATDNGVDQGVFLNEITN